MVAPSGVNSGDQLADRLVLGALGGQGQLGKRRVVLDDRVDLGDVDPRVAVHARHLLVDLCQHDVGRLDRRLVGVHVRAEAHVAVPVHAGDADHRDGDVHELRE